MSPTVQMLDRAAAPSAQQAEAACSSVSQSTGMPCGWVVYCGGGGSAATGWTPALVAALLGKVPLFPIWVPPQNFTNPESAADEWFAYQEALQNFGLATAPAVAVDMEPGATALAGGLASQWLAWWCGVAKTNRKVAYGVPKFLDTVTAPPNAPDAVWAAAPYYNLPRPLNPHGIPDLADGLWSAPGQRAWQYGTGDVLGMTVDFSVFDSELVVPT